MATTSWRARAVAGYGIKIDLLDGEEPIEGESAGQHFVIQRRDGVGVELRIGSTATLAWWRTTFGERKLELGAETSVTVCGRSGGRQEVLVPEVTATGFMASGHHIESRTPAKVHIAVSCRTNAGTPFVASWIVDADKRDALRADEDHFFESIRCG